MTGKRLYVAVLLAALLWNATEAMAGCYGFGEVGVKVPRGAAGTKATIWGKNFLFDCPDTCMEMRLPDGSVQGNCPPPPPSPAKQIRLLFVQGEKVQELLRTDAKSDFSIEAEVLIPEAAPPGAATIFAEYQNVNGLIKTSPHAFTVLPKQ
jgi:hypothetical protein